MKPKNDLNTAFNFTDDDLIYNRRGELSPRQNRILHFKNVPTLFAGLFILFSSALIFGSLINWGLVPVMVFIGEPILVIAFIITNGRIYLDRRAKRVDQTEGSIGLYGGGIARVQNYEFRLSSRQYKILRQAATYRVYFTPRLRIVVAAEELSRD